MIETGYPIGPGFFIFFQDIKRGGPTERAKIDHDRILKDDNEILEIITMLANCDGFKRLY